MNRGQDVWDESVQGVAMYKVVIKLKKLKGSLNALNREKISNILIMKLRFLS